MGIEERRRTCRQVGGTKCRNRKMHRHGGQSPLLIGEMNYEANKKNNM